MMLQCDEYQENWDDEMNSHQSEELMTFDDYLWAVVWENQMKSDEYYGV